jgi:hypothetical protein
MEKKYKTIETELMVAKEPMVEYGVSEINVSQLPYMSTQEMLQHGMPLETSRKIIFDMIHADFHSDGV